MPPYKVLQRNTELKKKIKKQKQTNDVDGRTSVLSVPLIWSKDFFSIWTVMVN